MSTKITQLKGQAFLPFPDMTQTLQSELRDRFGVTAVPANTYGELLFYNQKDLPEQLIELSPYFARTVMKEPFMVTFASIGEAGHHISTLVSAVHSLFRINFHI